MNTGRAGVVSAPVPIRGWMAFVLKAPAFSSVTPTKRAIWAVIIMPSIWTMPACRVAMECAMQPPPSLPSSSPTPTPSYPPS